MDRDHQPPPPKILSPEEQARRRWEEDSRRRKEEALRDMRRERGERRWRALLQAAEAGRHAPLEYLLRLMASAGVPDFAGRYAADRFSGKIGPPGRPARPPLDTRDLETLQYHFDGGRIPWSGVAARNGVESLFPSQFVAVAAVRCLHARCKAFETTREPRHANKPRLQYIESRGVWRVKNPKGEARRRVARDWGVKPSTLAEWERRIRAWAEGASFPLSMNPNTPRKDPQP